MGAIYLIRHAQASVTSFNYDELSETGLEQAALLGPELRRRLKVVDIVRHGTMKRHIQTFDAVRPHLPVIVQPKADPRWNEYDHMDIIRQYNPLYKNRVLLLADMFRKLNPRRDFERMFLSAMDRWLEGGHDGEYRESWKAYRRRCIAALEKVSSEAGESGTALVFTSGGVISALLQHSLNLPDHYFMDFNKRIVNGSITKFVRGKKSWFVSTINDHSVFERQPGLITYV